MKIKNPYFPFYSLYVLFSSAMFFWSYTQVDLNLTLSKAGFWQQVQKYFIEVGYFNRPVSAWIIFGIIIGLYILYFIVVACTHRGFLKMSNLVTLLGVVMIFFVFSYPAFSYDIYNYMFTAKTVVVYHQNPYVVKPIEFAGIDPWVNFMRWTHLPSAYSPLWIALSIPVYFLGMGYFITTLFVFKLFFALIFASSCIVVYQIAKRFDTDHAGVIFSLYAFNPLVLVESLVSPHNDSVMVLFALIAFYMFTVRRTFLSFLLLSLSAAVKTMTVFLIPLYVFSWKRTYALFFISLALIIGFYKKEFLGWYYLWVAPFVALYPKRYFLQLFYGSVSLGLIMRYIPYIFAGDYTEPVNMWRTIVLVLPPLFVVSIYLVIHWRKHV